MKTLGIVAEYNPFHRGHQWQIGKMRETFGDCAVVCAMSGNWVQRGECAVTDKWSRAAMALRGGADLLLELPTPWAVASAEGFARGGVSVLAQAGVETLCFGCELGEAETLGRVARALDSGEYPPLLRQNLDLGMTFAAARQGAVTQLLGAEASCLEWPNNNLAIEYLRTLPQGMEAVALPRVGADHDGVGTGEYASASAIRGLLRGRDPAAKYLTGPFLGELADMEGAERAVLYRLRSMTAADFLRLPDCGPELAGRLVAAAAAGRSLQEVYDLAKTRRYAHARIRRLVLYAFLGLRAGERPDQVPYLRVLGMNQRGREVLAGLKKTCPMPVIIKPAKHKTLLAREGGYTDLFGLCHQTPWPCGREFTTGPVIL